MGNYEKLKQSITEVIRTNGNQEITGAVLQSTLLTIISTVGANATFAGIATPTTNPGTPDGPVFWIASESGTYSNFGSIVLQAGLSVLMWNGSWSSQQIFGVDDVPTAESNNLVKSGGVYAKIKALEDAGYIFVGIATPTTNPGTPNKKVFYLASESGTYTNFNATELQDGLSVLMWNGSWSSQQIFGVDDEPTAGSDNLVKSGGVYNSTPSIVNSDNESDLDIEDQLGNKLARFMGGNIKTKHFDSSTDAPISSDDTQIIGDLEFADINDNVLMLLYNGHVKTKDFDSSSIEKKNISQSLWKLINSVNLVNVFKKVCCIGDSLTAGYTKIGSVNIGSAAARPLGNNWPSYMENLTGGNQYDNIAIGSSTTHHWRYEDGPQPDYKPDLDLANDLTYEAYIIALGVNDERTNVTVGTTADILPSKSSNADTFCGNYDYIVRQLMEWNSKAHIFCLTIPLSEGNKVIPYNTIISEIGSLYPNKVHVISLEGDDVNLSWIAANFASGHYCPIVYNYFATIIYRRISDTIFDNNIIFRETPYN